MNRQSASVSRGWKRFSADQSATALLDFAILAPLFILLVFGVIVFGWSLYTMSTVNLAAEHVGRLMQLDPSMSSEQVSQRVRAELPHLDQDNLDISVASETVTGYRVARATVSYEFTLDLPLVGSYPLHYTTTVSVPQI